MNICIKNKNKANLFVSNCNRSDSKLILKNEQNDQQNNTIYRYYEYLIQFIFLMK